MNKKVLLVGETCVNQWICIKGFDSFVSCNYEEEFHFIQKSIEKGGFEFHHIACHEVDAKFPATVEALKQYDCLILSDVGSNSFLLRNETYKQGTICPNRCDVIRDYVLDGGAFLMIGGYMAFNGFEGKAGYGRTAVGEILPVECLSCDDRRECPEGAHPQYTQPHPALQGLPAQWPAVLGYNRTILKKGCVQPVTIYGDPLVAFGEFGKGRSGVFTSDCAPHWAPEGFTGWEHYDDLWNGILRYLMKI